MKNHSILRVEDLSIDYIVLGGSLKAVRNVSFEIYEGEVVCLVGESGSGKSTVGLAIAGALPENAIIHSGRIIFMGKNLLEAETRNKKVNNIMIVFQDPAATLNPLFKVGEVISDVIKTHLHIKEREKIKEKALEMFRMVELP
ncbi:MAG: ATP-binding cassette domain-containing protein, partial [Nitrososphaerota archaeon]